jgi:hypothetical protein
MCGSGSAEIARTLRSKRCFIGAGALQPRVARLVHFAHAAGAERRLDFVRTKFRSDRKRHFLRTSIQFVTSFKGGAFSSRATGRSARLPSWVTYSPVPTIPC